jgi:hypothetical protein
MSKNSSVPLMAQSVRSKINESIIANGDKSLQKTELLLIKMEKKLNALKSMSEMACHGVVHNQKGGNFVVQNYPPEPKLMSKRRKSAAGYTKGNKHGYDTTPTAICFTLGIKSMKD